MMRPLPSPGGLHRRAFTLPETLVALALCAVLAFLGVAALRTARRQARSLQAQHSLRLMGSALAAHTTEYDGRLLSGATGTLLAAGELQSQAGPATAFWFNALDYYLGGDDYTLEGMKRIERPAWQGDPSKTYGAGTPRRHGLYGIAIGFGWNHQYFGYDRQPINATFGWNSRLAEVSFPARTIIIGSGEDSENLTNPLRNTMIYANSIRCRRHDGGGYYLFLDGHVEKKTPEEVMADGSWLMKKRK
ncbi:MAG TPA: prepilin-type N-terminal cleavage/methylation domain-containing protein [Chthoniobacteraceae bacterium]|nr:prepilin-type N-terminal cleavage/methylation domain-containing protein [Chthoniobacteraceae bacterium]